MSRGLFNGVLGRAPTPSLEEVMMSRTSVSGLMRERAACLHGLSYKVFSRIFMTGPLAELEEYPLQVEPLATLSA